MNKKIVRTVPITFIGEKVGEIQTVKFVPMTQQEINVRNAAVAIMTFAVTLILGAII